MANAEKYAADDQKSDSESVNQNRPLLYFGLDLALRSRQLNSASIPYPKAEVFPAHKKLPLCPDDSHSAKTFLCKYKESARAYVNAAGAASDFKGWSDKALVAGGRRLHNVIRKNQASQIRFGIPRVRGFRSDPSQKIVHSDHIEIPYPGWMLRSLGFVGPANSRDVALFFKLIAVCNIYQEEHPDRTESDLLSWSIPHRKVVGNMFKGHLNRMVEALARLNATVFHSVDDIINPRRKLSLSPNLIRSFAVEKDTLRFSLDRSFCTAIMGQTRYAHVNVRTLLSLKSMYGVRAYLLGLGFCAPGAWSRSGGNARVLMKEDYLKHILLGDPNKIRTGEFRRDVISHVRKDLKRIEYVSDEEAVSRQITYEGRERMRMQFIYNPQRSDEFRDEFKADKSQVGIYISVSEASIQQRPKHKSDARVLRWRYKKVTFDLEAIKAKRNENRSEGIAKAKQVRAEAGMPSLISTPKRAILDDDAIARSFDANEEQVRTVAAITLIESSEIDEDADPENEDDVELAREEDDNPEGYIYDVEEE